MAQKVGHRVLVIIRPGGSQMIQAAVKTTQGIGCRPVSCLRSAGPP
jgi:hypothetical protein